MLQVELNASIRKVKGKGAMRQLRSKGLTPAVVYGAGSEAIALELETQPLFQKLLTIYRTNAIITLSLDDGSTKYVLVQDVQTDPIKDTLIHTDFLEIDVDAPRVFEVPVDFKGTPVGVDMGGVLNVIQDTIAVEAAPLAIPDSFEVDISDLNIGDSLKISSIDIPETLKLTADADSIFVNIVTQKRGSDDVDEVEEGDEVVEEEAAAAPEEE